MASSRAKAGRGVESDMSAAAYQIKYQNTLPANSFFGPSTAPSAQAPKEVAGRKWDYPAAFNLHTKPRVGYRVTFAMLRGLADGHDLTRLAIETRKDQIEALQWTIERNPEIKEDEVGERFEERLAFIKSFMKKPDRKMLFGRWIRAMVEEILVTDALSIFPRRTRNGNIYAAKLIDGATIKKVIDDWGDVPIEGVAYQQILKGIVAVDYQDYSYESKARWKLDGLPELMYMPRNQRVSSPYGFSPVEQVITTISIAIGRQTSQAAYFSEGNIPESLMGVPDDWDAKDIQEFQEWWDGMLAGEIEGRRRARFVNETMAKTYTETKSSEIFGKAEEWIARVICWAFSISPQALTSQMNRATAETAASTAEDEGLIPLKNFIAEVINYFLEIEFNSPDIVFKWVDASRISEKTKRELNVNEYNAGITSRNEARLALNLPPDDEDPEANKPKKAAAPVGIPDLTGKKDGEEAKKAEEPETEEPEEGEEAEKVEKSDIHVCDGGCSLHKQDTSSDLAKADATKSSPLSLDRKVARRLKKLVAQICAEHLAEMGDDVSVALIKATRTLSKADTDERFIDWEAVFGAVLTPAMKKMVGDILDDLTEMAADAAKTAAEMITYANFDRVNEAAVMLMAARGAELVKGLEETTRIFLRETIAKGLADNIGMPAIADAIQESFMFSEARAKVIAVSEIAWANSNSSLQTYKIAESEGVDVKKAWLLGPDPCDICKANAEQGAIPLDQKFQSGHDCPNAHPNCECALTPVITDSPTQ